MTPAALLRKAAEQIARDDSTWKFASQLSSNVIYSGATAEDDHDKRMELLFEAQSRLGREVRDEEVRRLRAAADRWDSEVGGKEAGA